MVIFPRKEGPYVVKLVEDGWNKLVAERRTRGAKTRGDSYVECAKVQIVDTERRYNVLVKYATDLPPIYMLLRSIFDMKTQRDPLTISCHKGDIAISILKKSNSGWSQKTHYFYPFFSLFYFNLKFTSREG
ncbi:Protein of unknown function [Cotesia congregata]|uniref:Uncharacterized protein n=1 Tax=Cotesia congregata TaxID=51543 RepID=A0A8J2H2E9_COTCN|nr:Protein of unknown function [Cotesia congregata]